MRALLKKLENLQLLSDKKFHRRYSPKGRKSTQFRLYPLSSKVIYHQCDHYEKYQQLKCHRTHKILFDHSLKCAWLKVFLVKGGVLFNLID